MSTDTFKLSAICRAIPAFAVSAHVLQGITHCDHVGSDTFPVFRVLQENNTDRGPHPGLYGETRGKIEVNLADSSE